MSNIRIGNNGLCPPCLLARWVLWMLTWWVVPCLWGSANPSMQSLIDRPPFRAAAEPARGVSEEISTQGAINQRFEFTGIFESAGRVKISIRDSGSGRSFWLVPGESIEDVKLESYDHSQRAVVISQGVRRELVKLREHQSPSTGGGLDSPSLNPSRFNLPKTSGLPSVSPNRGVPSVPSMPPKMPVPPSMVDQLRNQSNPR